MMNRLSKTILKNSLLLTCKNNSNNSIKLLRQFSTIKPPTEESTTESINKDEILNNEYDKEILKYTPNAKYLAREEMNKEKKLHLSFLGFYSKDTISLHNSYYIYDAIAQQSSDIEFYKQSNLPVNVRSWFAITVLHLWVVFVHLRKDPKASKQLSIDLYDRFWEDLERRIATAGINRRYIPKYLKDFYTTYLGSLISYDESLFDDTTLVNALWRNFYAMNNEITPQQLLDMVKFIRVQLNHLDSLPNIIDKGELTFKSIKDLKKY